VRLNSDLDYEDVQHIPYYQNACMTINALIEENGKTKATGNGYLNRKFVERLFEKLVITEEERNRIRITCKVINERDAKSLHLTRVLLDLAGCLKLRGNYFSATQKGKKLVAEKLAGAFYALLFKTHYNVLNLSYLDAWGENPALQSGVSFTLYQLSKRANEWILLSDILNQIVLPAAFDYADRRLQPPEKALQLPVVLRIIEPLRNFGLLEIAENNEPWDRKYEMMRFRKTPLFDRFLQFHLDLRNVR